MPHRAPRCLFDVMTRPRRPSRTHPGDACAHGPPLSVSLTLLVLSPVAVGPNLGPGESEANRRPSSLSLSIPWLPSLWLPAIPARAFALNCGEMTTATAQMSTTQSLPSATRADW